MPIFMGAKGEDVLSRRGTADFLARLRQELYGRLAHLPPGEDLALLAGLEEKLREEIASEERFSGEFSRELAELDEAGDSASLTTLLQRLRAMAAEHFRRHGSVPAFHLLCTAAVDRAVAAAVRLTLRWMEEIGPGAPSSPWCLMAIGEVGRGEASLFSLCDLLQIHGSDGAEEAPIFAGFAGRISALCEEIGLASRTGIGPSLPAWRGSMADWRSRITARCTEGGEDMEGVVRMADLRLVAGNPSLAAAAVNLVRAMLDYHREPLREAARRTAMMPSGFDFFGRLRVERGGAHRGEFNLGLYGIEPLVALVRVLTVRFDVSETGTVERIRGLLQGGRIDVELAERLLFAWHALGGLAVAEEIGRGERAGGLFVSPGTLSEHALEELKRSLEAVGTLQKMVYSSVSGQW
ncbi:putative nucleotidyltransferase substrate binding domain-containing protein [Geobacter sp.]|uniref:putative nucleotidyltransferase substrate binding domain-containing protein n=1 Tax=Geobacter sp. TaxID=46610 RepID=UPI0026076B8B|nr:putative nucleotidyltransferase substrate binding domain-containing protein [Geobacter sp.]